VPIRGLLIFVDSYESEDDSGNGSIFEKARLSRPGIIVQAESKKNPARFAD
jgi:hypothetical protein